MKRITFALVLLCALSAQATQLTVKFKDLVGSVPDAYAELSLVNCGGYIPAASDSLYLGAPVKLFPNASGTVTVTVPDQATLTCGTSLGVAWYRVTMFWRTSTATAYTKGNTSEYDISGSAPVTIPGAPLHAGSPVPAVNGNANQWNGKPLCAGVPSDGQGYFWNAARSCYELNSTGAASVPDASAGAKGKLQLAGDLGGTADAPTVPGLATKADDSAVVHKTGDQTINGELTATKFHGDGSALSGIASGATPLVSGVSTCVFEGDSISAGYGLSAGQDWPSQLLTLAGWTTCTKYNVATSGETAVQIATEYAAQVAPHKPTGGTKAALFLLAGTNDVWHQTTDAASIYAAISGEWAAAKADGYKVVAFTIPPGGGTWDSTREAVRATVNASIRAAASNYDALVDFDRLLPYAPDTALYQDSIHPTATGANLLAQYTAQILAGTLKNPTSGVSQAAMAADGTRSNPTFYFYGNGKLGAYRNSTYGEKVSFTNGTLDLGGFGVGNSGNGFDTLPGVWTSQCFYWANNAILTGTYQYQFGGDNRICNANVGGGTDAVLFRNATGAGYMGWTRLYHSDTDWGGLRTYTSGTFAGLKATRLGASEDTWTGAAFGSDNSVTHVFAAGGNTVSIGADPANEFADGNVIEATVPSSSGGARSLKFPALKAATGTWYLCADTTGTITSSTTTCSGTTLGTAAAANLPTCTGTDKLTSNGTAITCSADQNSGTGGGVTLPTTANLLKGDNAGAAVAATPGTDYLTPAGANSTYETQAAFATAIAGYLTSTTAASTYLTQASAASTYALVGHNHTGTYEAANANIQTHIASTANPHGVTKAQVGLGNADNTSDAGKPVSTAQQSALDLKLNATDASVTNARTPTAHATSHVTGGADVIANVVAAGNAGLMSGADKTKLDGIATGATVGADWLTNVSNKPTIPAAQIQSDWTQASNIALDYIKNKPTIPAAQVQSDWNAVSGMGQILNKPTLGTAAAAASTDFATAGHNHTGTYEPVLNAAGVVAKFGGGSCSGYLKSDGTCATPAGSVTPAGSSGDLQTNNGTGGLGSVAQSTFAAASHTQAESTINFTDVTTNNVSTTAHGYTPKLPNDATKYLDGTGAFSVPAGGGGSSLGAVFVQNLGTAAVPATTTTYYPVTGLNSASTDANRRMPMPTACTFRNLYVEASGNLPASSQATLTVTIEGTPSALTCTIAAGASACNDTTHTAAVTAGQHVSMEAKNTLSVSTGSTIKGWAFQCN